MEIALLIWFANIAPSLSNFLGFIGFFMVLGGLVLAALAHLVSDEDRNKPVFFKKRKWVFNVITVLGLLMGLTANLIPDERTVYLMAGGYMAQKVVTSDKFNTSANDVYEIVNLKLKKIKEDLKEEVNEK